MEAEKRKTSSGMLIPFLKGVLMSVIGGSVRPCGGAIIKYVKNVHVWQFVIYANWACFSFALPWAICSGENLLGPRDFRLTIFIRSVLTVTSIALQSVSVRYLPLGEAIVLSTSTPIFVTIAAKIFLKESLNLLKVLSVISCIVGIILISRVFQVMTQDSRVYTINDIYGISAALSSLAFSTANIIITRKIRHVHQSIMMLNASVVSVLLATILTACVSGFSLHYRGLQQGLMIAFGVICIISQVAFLLALKFMEAGPCTTIWICSMSLAGFLLQILIFHDIPDGMVIIGCILVGSSVIIVVMSKHINSFFSNKCWLSFEHKK